MGSITSCKNTSLVWVDARRKDPETRKVIRRHVMAGKTRQRNDGISVNHPDPRLQFVQEAISGILYPAIGSSFSFTSFPDLIKRRDAAEALVYAETIARGRYVLSTFLIFEKIPNFWVEQLSIDAPLLQSIILVTKTYFHCLKRGADSVQLGRTDELKAIQLLRRKLSCGTAEEQISGTTLFIIANLAASARIANDFVSCRQHLAGAFRIIRLLGGHGDIRESKAVIEVLRCDLGIALETGAPPIFQEIRSIDLDVIELYPGDLTPHPYSEPFESDLDPSLLRAWQTLKSFSSMIELVDVARGKITWKLFLDTMASVMYRLLMLKFGIGTTNETIRLACLAIGSQVFLQWKDFTTTYAHLTEEYKYSLYHLSQARGTVSSATLCWLYMIGGMFEPQLTEESWWRFTMEEKMNELGIGSWGEMRTILNSILWVRSIHDIPGRALFHAYGMRTDSQPGMNTHSAEVG